MTTHRWQQALDAHEAAIEACIATARRIPDSDWETPRATGKWSAAQTLTHVGLAYQMVYDDLHGKPPAPRLPRLKQFLLRTFFLPRLLRTNQFREGVPAPRELRPDSERLDRAASEELLRTRARAGVEALMTAQEQGTRVTHHPYFGSMSLLSMLRLGTSHTRHHTRILAKAAGE